jgi:excisionase family DNA binding protein
MAVEIFDPAPLRSFPIKSQLAMPALPLAVHWNREMADHQNSSVRADRLIDDHELATITGRKRSTIQKDRLHGGGIPFVRIGRLVRYRMSDVSAWMASLPALRSTSEAA